jgi:starch synthase
MKVAFISFDFGEYCVRLAGEISQHTDLLLFLPRYEAEPYQHLLTNPAGLRVFDPPRLRQPLPQMQMAAHLMRQIRDFHPDVVHLQGGQLWLNGALPMLGRRPLVVTVHDAVTHPGDMEARRTPQWVRDYGYYRAQERIVHAPQIRDLLLQRLNIPSSTVHVIPHIYVGGPATTEPVQEEENLILFFGRLWKYKGLEYLIRAEPLITARVPQAKIVIAGRGESFERYRRMMVHPERFTVYNEHISVAKRADLFRRASVVVLPYIEASQSGVIPIAYRFGKPVVATAVGGLPEMVDHGHTGYLVPPRDPQALADAVVLLLQDRELRRRFGENGRRKINAECAPEIVGQMTRAVYRNANKCWRAKRR